MNILSWPRLSSELDELFKEEQHLRWDISTSCVGPEQWIPFADVRMRDRLVKVLLSDTPPAGVSGTGSASKDKILWHDAWVPILTAIGVLPPQVDPCALRSLASSREQICFVADTSAMAGGVVSWLCRIRWHGQVELVIPTVVTRELFGWADQSGFWNPKLASLPQRVQYRLAQRLSETRPNNVRVHRPPSEDRAALMLAKVKLRRGDKSPDADVLLMELARDQQRTQPPGVRVFYVTGDLNHSRTAAANMGHQSVIYAPTARLNFGSCIGQCAFWRPSEGLGAMRLLSSAEMAWDLLALTSKIRVVGSHMEVEIRNVFEGNGCPSDWANPAFSVEVLRSSAPSGQAPLNDALVPERSAGPSVETGTLSDRKGVDGGLDFYPKETLLRSPDYPIPLPEGPTRSPSAQDLAHMLAMGLAGERIPKMPRSSRSAHESFNFLVSAGAILPSGLPDLLSPVWNLLKAADWDGLNVEFGKVPGYLATLEKVRREPYAVRSSTERALLTIARRLGQAASLSQKEPVRVGDKGIDSSSLVTFLESALPEVGRDYSVDDVARMALDQLELTPARFERALQELNRKGYAGVTYETGGSVSSGWQERVWSLSQGAIIEVPVGTDAFYFGGDRPIRKLRRRQ